MLKAAGAALVLISSLLYGWQLRLRLSGHLEQLLDLKELLSMLSGEIAYARATLPEAFGRIARRQGGPYEEILLTIARRMEQPGESLGTVWREVWEEAGRKLLLSEEELQIVLGLGKNLGYLDIDMQLGHIAMYTSQLEERIAQASSQLAVKQKLYQYLSVMSGLFLILILI